MNSATRANNASGTTTATVPASIESTHDYEIAETPLPMALRLRIDRSGDVRMDRASIACRDRLC